MSPSLPLSCTEKLSPFFRFVIPGWAGPNASETTEATFGPAFAVSPILARTFREVADGPPVDLCGAERFPRHAIDAFFLQRRPGDKQLYGPAAGCLRCRRYRG